MLAALIVNFYSFWHGKLHLKGAGLLAQLLLPFTPGLRAYCLKLKEKQTITVDFRDISAVAWLNYLLGDSIEEESLLVAIRQFSKRSIIWDVGANGGLFSYRLIKEKIASKVFFFEPNPSLFAIASDALHPFGNASGFQYALSSKPGSAFLTIPAGDSASATLEVERTGRLGERLSVRCETGDNLLAQHEVEVPQIIKIDAEGHEMDVMSGLKQIIATHRPVIFFEHISLSDEEIQRLVPYGYYIATVNNRDGTLSSTFDRSVGHNSALIPLAS